MKTNLLKAIIFLVIITNKTTQKLPVGPQMIDPKKVLITGGNGMIGNRLTALLIAKGYRVSHLRRSRNNAKVETFLWDPGTGKIETPAFRDVDVIIHLAGAGIADKRWSRKRKNEILTSRTMGARLIREALQKETHQIRDFISASGINYYGLADVGRAFVESDPPGHDFMANVTQAWEREADAFLSLGIRVTKVRTGVALGPKSIALTRIAQPVKFFVGAPLGTGKQFFNWIHLDDLCRIYIKAIEEASMHGAYNAVAPTPVTNAELTKEIARVLKKPLWLPPVPGFVVKLIAGEVAEVVLNGGRVSCEKIHNAGFDFQFDTLASALKAIYSR
jgi:uncharacterized protein (TIGR01777 family)